MMDYDVIVVGAGPAGGQCARELSSKGRKVLLIEKAKSFEDNNYSSGGGPEEMMEAFQLPSSIVGSNWNHMTIQSTHEKVTWSSAQPMGPILDFDKLRGFLANETLRSGGEFKLGCQYLSHQVIDKGVLVKFRNQANEEEGKFSAKLLIDATGSERKVLLNQQYNRGKALGFTGIEYHIQVQPEHYQQFKESMNFFLGHRWMPQGYGWIFSMGKNRLKVGVIRYFQNQTLTEGHPSYRHYLDQLLTLCGEGYEILDRHGKTIHYTFGQKDKYFEGPVLAIGDAISAINPLGCEGIRHALISGRQAAKAVEEFLEGNLSALEGYQKSMKSYFGWKWYLSEKMINWLFKNNHDFYLDRLVAGFKFMSREDLLEVIFNYRFSRSIKSFMWYFGTRIKDTFYRRKWKPQ